MQRKPDPLLTIRDLDVRFGTRKAERRVIRGVDLTIHPSEIHALVGESGSGKTVTAKAVLGLIPSPPGRIAGGEIGFKGRDILSLGREAYRRIRGAEIGMIFQEPGRHLNPSMRIGRQIGEMLAVHLSLRGEENRRKTDALLERVGLEVRTARAYPHELSGGMKQRAMIAMAVSCTPSLLIADEPTTALDVTLQLQILGLLGSLRDEFAMSVLLISHDLRVVEDSADRVSVMYAGRIVETASREELFDNPLHPYTVLLLASIPTADKRGRRLRVISGRVPEAGHLPSGCPFHPRCPLAEEICRRVDPPFIAHEGEEHRAACHMIGKKSLAGLTGGMGGPQDASGEPATGSPGGVP